MRNTEEASMGHLEALTVVAKPNLRPATSEEQKRHKLIIKLQEQLSMIEAELSGKSYKRMKWVTLPNIHGEPERIQRPVRVKQWWFKDRGGNVLFAVRYGAKPIHIQKDKSAIQVSSTADLPAVINTLIRAVDAGELDAQLSSLHTDSVALPQNKKSISKLTR
jgi:hypothetical protein